MGKIYLITNTNNGKCYVGQTKNNVSQRFAQHIDGAYRCYDNKQSDFYKDIVKVGEDVFNVFKYKILEECSDNNLNEREIYWIKKIKPLYNWAHRNEYLEHIYNDEICNLYKNGYTITEIRKKYKCRHNEIVKILNKNNIQIVRARPQIKNRKKIYHFDLYGNLIKEYNYIAECANALGFKRDNIRLCAINNTKKGYLFNTAFDEYFSYNKEQPYIYQIINCKTQEKILVKTKKALEKEMEKKLGKYLSYGQLTRNGRKTIYGYKIINIKENINEIMAL